MENERQLRVLCISARSDIGGGPRHLFDLGHELIKSSQVKLSIASPLEAPFGEEYQRMTHSHMEIPHRRFSFLKCFQLLAYCKQNEIDIVHSHGRGAGIYSRLLGLFNIKVIHTFHGAHLGQSFGAKLKVIVDRLLRYGARKYICVSIDERAEAIKNGFSDVDNSQLICNGVALSEFDEKQYIESVKKIGTLTRLDPGKGLFELIDFFNRFYSSRPKFDFEITIMGEGEIKEALKEKIIELGLETKIFLPGPTATPRDFLNSLDLFVSFSHREGMPLSVLEAMAEGIPVLLSDVVGHKSLAVNNGAELFELTNYDEFECKLLELLESVNRRNLSAQTSLSKIKNEHTVEIMTNKTLELYKKINYER